MKLILGPYRYKVSTEKYIPEYLLHSPRTSRENTDLLLVRNGDMGWLPVKTFASNTRQSAQFNRILSGLVETKLSASRGMSMKRQRSLMLRGHDQ